jgi:hypothetical protein
MLKFSVQTSYQPLFSHSFPFSNIPEILFPSVILFPSKIFPHQKAQTKGGFYKQRKQEGTKALGRGVTL